MNIRFLTTAITPLVGLAVGLAAAKKLHAMNVVWGALLGFAVGVAVMVAVSKAVDGLIKSFDLPTVPQTLAKEIVGWAALLLLLIAPIVSAVGAHFAVVAFRSM